MSYTYPDKLTRDNVVAPCLLLYLVTVSLSTQQHNNPNTKVYVKQHEIEA